MLYRLKTNILGPDGTLYLADTTGTKKDFPGIDVDSHVEAGNIEDLREKPKSERPQHDENMQVVVGKLEEAAAELDDLRVVNGFLQARWDALTEDEKAEVETRLTVALTVETTDEPEDPAPVGATEPPSVEDDSGQPDPGDEKRKELEAMTVDRLKAAAKERGVSPVPERKADLVDALLALEA